MNHDFLFLALDFLQVEELWNSVRPTCSLLHYLVQSYSDIICIYDGNASCYSDGIAIIVMHE